MQKQARITSKGQITVPREVRRILGVRAGDRLLFESDGRVSASGRSATRACSRSTAVLAIRRSGRAEEAHSAWRPRRLWRRHSIGEAW
ncbi:MAG: AbrB/MazE/SpoVT family DNA-binding domain-containing protein [Terriglobales bacterium]